VCRKGHSILRDYTTLTNSGKSIVLCLIPNHVNIPGNERADAAAKSALSLHITGMKLPGCDLIPRVSNSLLLTSLLILSDVLNVKNLPSSRICYQVFWP